MSKAVITILGLTSEQKEKDRAEYTLSKELKKNLTIKDKKYTNMFPLLIDNFKEDYEILPIFTELSFEKQIKVLESEKLNFKEFKEDFKIEDEKDFSEIFYIINDALSSNYDEFIVDLTHGFRHLPILAIVNLIIHDIKDSTKIKHILFAKEIIQFKEYEIIDLKEYLDIAKLSFVLSSFNSNYTVGNNMIFSNENYQELVDNLRIVSTHILANSLKQLIGDDSLISETIQILKNLLNDKKLQLFTTYIEEIITHLGKIQSLDKEKEYIQFFQLAKMMRNRGYLLNSITLLNEAMGFYCVEHLKMLGDDISEYIEEFRTTENYAYELTSNSKNIIKLLNSYNGSYLFKKKGTNLEKKHFIIKELEKQDNEVLIILIKDIENLRNNLAHGNSSEKIENIVIELKKLFYHFKQITNIDKIEIDINSVQKNNNERKNIPIKENKNRIKLLIEQITDFFNFFNFFNRK